MDAAQPPSATSPRRSPCSLLQLTPHPWLPAPKLVVLGTFPSLDWIRPALLSASPMAELALAPNAGRAPLLHPIWTPSDELARALLPLVVRRVRALCLPRW